MYKRDAKQDIKTKKKLFFSKTSIFFIEQRFTIQNFCQIGQN